MERIKPGSKDCHCGVREGAMTTEELVVSEKNWCVGEKTCPPVAGLEDPGRGLQAHQDWQPLEQGNGPSSRGSRRSTAQMTP